MDLWAAVIDSCTQDETIVGIYTTEELALSIAMRISPEAADAVRFVLDEAPDWLAAFEQGRDRLAAGRTQPGVPLPPSEETKQL
jgi:hypothetical protein